MILLKDRGIRVNNIFLSFQIANFAYLLLKVMLKLNLQEWDIIFQAKENKLLFVCFLYQKTKKIQLSV
jgi:hypothetical protein